MNLKVLKLLSGEEIIAEVVGSNQTDFDYKLKNCLMLLMTQDAQKGFGISIVPWAQHSENGEVTIHKNHVIYATTPRKELVDMYESTFSPIAIPKKGLIVG